MNDLIRIVALVCTLAAPSAAGQTIDVVRADGRTTAVALGTLERRSVTTEDRGLQTTFDGVYLRDVLSAAGVEFGEALKGRALAQVVIASARDGYRVAYAIAELDPAFTERIVLLADRRDGRPLLADTGPLQIVVVGEKRPARWIRQLLKLEVKQF